MRENCTLTHLCVQRVRQVVSRQVRSGDWRNLCGPCVISWPARGCRLLAALAVLRARQSRCRPRRTTVINARTLATQTESRVSVAGTTFRRRSRLSEVSRSDRVYITSPLVVSYVDKLASSDSNTLREKKSGPTGTSPA